MTIFPALLTLLAACLHALWNALVKGTADRAATLGLIALGHVIPGVLLALFVDAPAPASWVFIAASTVIHWGYYLTLNVAYGLGDLSLVYPIARGLSPVLVALGAMVWADEVLPLAAWGGLLAVSGGILCLAAGRGYDPRALGAASLAALSIAAYSLVDGIGVRLSGSPLGYIAWLFMAEICVVIFVALYRRRALRSLPRSIWMVGFMGGCLSALAYGLVLYAKTLAPLAVVSALRETSVVIAALIGVVWFGERPVLRRVLASGIVAGGIALLSLG